MFTYKSQSRRFVTTGGQSLSFPSDAKVEIELLPGTAFGIDESPSRTIVRARKADVIIDAIHGRMLFKSNPPLECLEAISDGTETSVALKGNRLIYTFPCDSLTQLEQSICAVAFFLPTILNLGFPDPPLVEIVRGSVGTTKFRWEYCPEECQTVTHTVTQAQLEEFALKAFGYMPLFNGIGNRRLAAALSYFHSAVRLYTAGHNRWEFLAEAVLNYAKCLEVLFVSSERSMDNIRTELKNLGYDSSEIDVDFIPVVLLRNSMDVGHHRIEIFPQKDLFIVYRFVESREFVFRKLLTRLLDSIQSSSYTLHQPVDLLVSSDSKRKFARLVKSMSDAMGDRSRENHEVSP